MDHMINAIMLSSIRNIRTKSLHLHGSNICLSFLDSSRVSVGSDQNALCFSVSNDQNGLHRKKELLQFATAQCTVTGTFQKNMIFCVLKYQKVAKRVRQIQTLKINVVKRIKLFYFIFISA